MRIGVIEYQAFKDVCAEMSGASGPSHIFFSALSGNVNMALAIFTGGFYVAFDNSSGATLLPGTFTSDFPAAVATGTSVQSAY